MKLVKFTTDTHSCFFLFSRRRKAARSSPLGKRCYHYWLMADPSQRFRCAPITFFWFWTLGDYEVLRTMDQHSQRFEEPIRTEIRRLKDLLAGIRMPFAKQEFERQKGREGKKGVPIKNEAFPIGVGSDGETMIFEIKGVPYNAAELIKEIEGFFCNIRSSDVLRALSVRTESF